MNEGYEKKASDILPVGWFWVEYEDGSGCLHGPNGERMFGYDKNSGEIQDIDGEYRRYDLCVRTEIPGLEQKLLEELESAEHVNIEDACPIMYVSSNWPYMRSMKYYILPAGNWIIEIHAFAELASRVAEVELMHHVDYGLRPYTLGKKIVAAANNAEKQFLYEDTVFSVEKILRDGKLFCRGSNSCYF